MTDRNRMVLSLTWILFNLFVVATTVRLGSFSKHIHQKINLAFSKLDRDTVFEAGDVIPLSMAQGAYLNVIALLVQVGVWVYVLFEG
jgi:hypothetical protein